MLELNSRARRRSSLTDERKSPSSLKHKSYSAMHGRRGSMPGACAKDHTVAKSRWQTLSATIQRITKGSSNEAEPQSFRFPAFEVIDIRPEVAPPTALNRLWFRVKAPDHPKVDLKICIRSPQSMKLQDLTGFNNTGNICVWPSEEVLGGFCLENLQLFDKKSVLELGAGMSGLAGLMVAQACSPTEVVISDGNQNSVENLEFVVNQNLSEKRINNVSVQLVRWANGVGDLTRDFDVVICADCLFFDEGRAQLLECLKKALKPGGIAIVIAPSRSGTFEDFVTQVRDDRSFVVTSQLDHYSRKISEVRKKLRSDPRYNENLHYPKLLRLEKGVK